MYTKKKWKRTKNIAKNNSKFRKRGKNNSGKNSDFLFHLILIHQNHKITKVWLCCVFTDKNILDDSY